VKGRGPVVTRSLEVPVLSRFAAHAGLVNLRQTFVHRGHVMVAVAPATGALSAILSRHLLAPEQRADRSALAKAIHTFFDMTLGRTW
jgi:hypothetical protein